MFQRLRKFEEMAREHGVPFDPQEHVGKTLSEFVGRARFQKFLKRRIHELKSEKKREQLLADVRNGIFPEGTSKEHRLILKAAAGDSKAENEAVRTYLPLMRYQLKKYVGTPRYEELLSRSHLAIVQAIRGFEPACGAKFSTHLTNVVQRRIIDVIREENAAQGIGRDVNDLRMAFENAEDKLAQKLGRQPLRAEVVESLGWTPEQADKAVQFSRIVSLEKTVGYLTPDTPLDSRRLREKDRVEDPQNVSNEVLARLFLKDLVAKSGLLKTNPRALKAFYMYHAEGYLMGEISKHMGVSAARVSQLISEARARLKKAAGEDTQQ